MQNSLKTQNQTCFKATGASSGTPETGRPENSPLPDPYRFLAAESATRRQNILLALTTRLSNEHAGCIECLSKGQGSA